MVTVEIVTPTGFQVLAAMLRHRETGMDRYAVAECSQADESTVHALLRTFINAGWVTPSRRNAPDTRKTPPDYG